MWKRIFHFAFSHCETESSNWICHTQHSYPLFTHSIVTLNELVWQSPNERILHLLFSLYLFAGMTRLQITSDDTVGGCNIHWQSWKHAESFQFQVAHSILIERQTLNVATSKPASLWHIIHRRPAETCECVHFRALLAYQARLLLLPSFPLTPVCSSSSRGTFR